MYHFVVHKPDTKTVKMVDTGTPFITVEIRKQKLSTFTTINRLTRRHSSFVRPCTYYVSSYRQCGILGLSGTQ